MDGGAVTVSWQKKRRVKIVADHSKTSQPDFLSNCQIYPELCHCHYFMVAELLVCAVPSSWQRGGGGDDVIFLRHDDYGGTAAVTHVLLACRPLGVTNGHVLPHAHSCACVCVRGRVCVFRGARFLPGGVFQ